MSDFQKKIKYQTAQQEDSTGRQLIAFCQQGWPYRPQLKGDLLSYWHVRGDLTLRDNLLLYDVLLFPRACKPQHCWKKMRNGHQDIQRCCQCTTSSVWWPGVSKHIEQLMKACPNCAKASTLVGPTLSKLQLDNSAGIVANTRKISD